MKTFEFKPMQWVLARDEDGEWTLCRFSHVSKIKNVYTYVMCGGYIYSPSCCIPYKGNKHLLGTTNPYVEPYEPKDGDFVYYEYESGCKYISIYDARREDCSYARLEIGYGVVINDEFRSSYKVRRAATEDEKKILLLKLNEVGNDWDAEKKQIVDLKWMPGVGERYWYPHAEARIPKFVPSEMHNNKNTMDRELIENNLAFRTESECQSFCDKLNNAIKNVK